MVVLDDDAPSSDSTIYGELVARRTLATSGPMMPVLVQWTTKDGIVHDIGEQLRVPNNGTSTKLTVRVPAAWEGYVTGVDAIGNASDIALAEASPGLWQVSIRNNALPTWLYVAVAIDGAALYGRGRLRGRRGGRSRVHLVEPHVVLPLGAAGSGSRRRCRRLRRGPGLRRHRPDDPSVGGRDHQGRHRSGLQRPRRTVLTAELRTRRCSPAGRPCASRGSRPGSPARPPCRWVPRCRRVAGRRAAAPFPRFQSRPPAP